ncbi:MAG: DUF1579 domain-containing protein [Sphingosinicella sp.]|nr:DUF1579 domain-containing protein [Sphingosinicella sp.]
MRNGAHDFDFQFGNWRVHHRVKLPAGSKEWIEFEGTSTARPVLGGNGNVEDNIFMKSSGVTRGLALRTYDPKTATWAIWWVDGRNPHGAMDPPVTGQFVNGVGTFYAEGIYDGKMMRTRFIWSRITLTTAQWEQAYSYDKGNSWKTNWVMQFERAP